MDVNEPYQTALDVKKAKNPVLIRIIGLLWTALNHEMVEAAGIEPATLAQPCGSD